METLWQDLRYGLRMLWKNAGLTAVAVLALALGIGANTAIFSVVNSVLLRPLPYKDPDRLVMIWNSFFRQGLSEVLVSAPEFVDYREQNQVFEHIAAYRTQGFNFIDGDEPERILGARVSASLFPLLGTEPARGRTFLPEEDSSEEKFVSWVKANAIRLDTLDWRSIDMKDLSFLERALEGKRIVYLGEPDHYIHEKYDYRLILVRYLFERGWRHIGHEIGRSDGKRIDQFIATGDPSHLDRVAIYGYRGALRSDRNDFTRGIGRIAEAKGEEWRATLLPEERWFAQQLRKLSETGPRASARIEFFGFDVDVLPGGGYEDLQALLDPYASNSTIGTFVANLLPGQVYSVWMLYDHGRHFDLFCPEESCLVESNKDRVEYLLSQVNARVFLLPLSPGDRHNKFLDENRNFICNGCDGRYANGILTRQADLLFFIREVTQVRPR